MEKCSTCEVIYLIAKKNFKLADKANAVGDVWDFPQEMNNPHPAPFPIIMLSINFFLAALTYLDDISIPMKFLLFFLAAIPVVPEPINGPKRSLALVVLTIGLLKLLGKGAG
jgi:hypothetical protein